MLTLRPYQREAIDIGIYGHFEKRSGNCLIVIPTGGGKSLVIAQFIQEAIANYSETRVLIATHTKELIAQNYSELMGLWPDAPAGIYSAGLKKRQHQAQILFCGIQSVHNKALLLQRVDIILIDEAHLLSEDNGSMYRKFIAELKQINPQLVVIGLTATPYRTGTGMLTDGDDALFERISYEVPITELIENGWLSPVISKSGISQIDTSQVHTRGGEFVAGELEAAAMDPDVIRGVVDEIVQYSDGRRGILVFSCGVDHGKALKEQLNRYFPTECVFGSSSDGERDFAINGFKAQNIRCLVNMGVLTTGFNAKHVDLVAMVRATKSTGLYVQIVGRLTRLFPGKENGLLLDFGGNIQRHGPLDALRIKAKGKGEGAMPMKLCPACEAENPIAARVCVNCGKEFEWQGAKVSQVAAGGALLTAQIETEWCEVKCVTYSRHTKEGKTPTLRVSYELSGYKSQSEWICIEHTGYPRQKAVNWWAQRAPGAPIPANVNDALLWADMLRKPARIGLRPDGQFKRIVAYDWPKIQATPAPPAVDLYEQLQPQPDEDEFATDWGVPF